MEVVTDRDRWPPPPSGTAVTIGAYDGVHLGHRALVSRTRELAAARAVPSVVVTFDRHPATVLRPGCAPGQLTDLRQKLELLEALAVDRVLVLTFDEARASEPAEDFVAEVLVGSLAARVVVVGPGFRFGKGAAGDAGLLADLGAANGFDVEIASAVVDAESGEVVSSTLVRRLLAAGDVAGAARLLARPHEVRAPVVKGAGRGSSLGFPTANLAVPPGTMVPAEGIYAGWYAGREVGPEPAALYVGRRPTFQDAGEPVLEAHLLSFSGDLLGDQARVGFEAMLRGDRRFSSPSELTAQMQADVSAARAVLGLGC